MAGIVDTQINRIRKRVWLSLPNLGALGNDATNGVTLAAGLDDLDQLWGELSSFGFGALKMTADGKYVSGAMPVPYDLDVKFPIGFRVLWSGDVTGSTADVLFILLQDVIKRGIVIAKASTALDVPLVTDPNADDAGDVSATDYLYQVTERGVRTNIGITRAEVDAVAWMTFNLEQQASTAITNIYVLGIMMDYVAQICQGIGSNSDRPLIS